MKPKKKSKGTRRKFLVDFCVEVEVDQAVFDAVLTDEWREMFYPFYTPDDVAGNLAYNLVQGRSLSSLDGFADLEENSVCIGPMDTDNVSEIEEPKPKPPRRHPKKVANERRSKNR